MISLVVFTVLALAPGDPLSNLAASTDIPAEVRENIRKQFGLDQPIYVRYFKWLAAVRPGRLGLLVRAAGSRRSTLISFRIPTTLWVIGLAYLIAVLIAIPLGVMTAARQYSWFDHIFTGAQLHRLLAADVLHRRAADHRVQRAACAGCRWSTTSRSPTRSSG